MRQILPFFFLLIGFSANAQVTSTFKADTISSIDNEKHAMVLVLYYPLGGIHLITAYFRNGRVMHILPAINSTSLPDVKSNHVGHVDAYLLTMLDYMDTLGFELVTSYRVQEQMQEFIFKRK